MSDQPQLTVVEDAPNPEPVEYTASIASDPEALPKDFVDGVQQIEKTLGAEVCFFLQRDDGESAISLAVFEAFFIKRALQKQDGNVALMIHSPGGDPRAAYKVAKLLNATYSKYVALVPRYAKSAATLMSLGAEKIILGTHAELGPLDMQVGDSESEESGSALNHVQSLERLSAFALDTFDRSMFLMITRSGKKVATVMPQALSFACSMVRPLLENIDVVKYTEMSRILKVGEEYAIRLMEPHYGTKVAKTIAGRLVTDYPEHGFVIDLVEANKLGIKVEAPTGGVAEGFTKVMHHMGKITAYGTLTPKAGADNV